MADGRVRVVGTDRTVSFADLAERGKPDQLVAEDAWTPQPTFPNGTHLVEVEIDPLTGRVDIVNYVVVDDFGVTINPLLLEGQVVGGAVQGIGQALMERTVYDKDSGQLVTASLMDYALPRADDAPAFHFETRNIPLHGQHSRCEGGRGGRYHWGCPGGHERDRGCALARLPHSSHRYAGDARAGVGRNSRGNAPAHAVSDKGTVAFSRGLAILRGRVSKVE